jgi:hypothetical protein
MQTMRHRHVAPLLLAAMLGACSTSQVASRPADEPPVQRRSATAEEALQVTGGILGAVLSLFSVVVVVH